MDTPRNAFFQYPEGLNEAKLVELIQTILDGIDRDQLMKDEHLPIVRHPLLQERIGTEVALNTEIHNLISNVASKTRSDQPTDVEEKILLANASNPKQMATSLAAFKEAITKLAPLNIDEIYPIDTFVSMLLMGKLKMPTHAQEAILYPAVNHDLYESSKDEILGVIENCRKKLLSWIEIADDKKATEFGKEVSAEADFAKDWFEKRAA
ncbi:MAG: hypothetical protein WC843_03835 [Candidatus Gracilibacteria bacterium]|jgi:hypothetical protein